MVGAATAATFRARRRLRDEPLIGNSPKETFP